MNRSVVFFPRTYEWPRPRDVEGDALRAVQRVFVRLLTRHRGGAK